MTTPEDGSRAAAGSYALRSRHIGDRRSPRIDAAFEIVYVDPGLLSFFGYAGASTATTPRCSAASPSGIDLRRRPRPSAGTSWWPSPAATDRIEICLCDGRRRAGAGPAWTSSTTSTTSTTPASCVEAIDVTESRAAEERYLDMVAHNDRLTGIIEATSDLVVVTDPDGSPLYLNEAAQDFYDLDDRRGHRRRHRGPHPPVGGGQVPPGGPAPPCVTDGIWTGELALLRNGLEVPVAVQCLAHRGVDGEIGWLSMVARDISERKEFESQLEHQATHDPLTGLPNRTLLLDRLRRPWPAAGAPARGVAVLFLDLDHFKVVNDSLGHGAGDRLLVDIAARLRRGPAPRRHRRPLRRRRVRRPLRGPDRRGRRRRSSPSGSARCVDRPLDVDDAEVFVR